MIIYGSKAVYVASRISTTETCPSCGIKGTILLSVYRRHAHVFWIPLFPFGKKGISQCQHCSHTMEVKEMPLYLQNEYNFFKSEVKGPIWQFSGLAIILALVAWGNISDRIQRDTELRYLADPQVDDIYDYELEPGRYSTFKVQEVSSDSVFLNINGYETSKRSGTKEINRRENYSDMVYSISREDLKEMYSQKDIFRILRE